jgi:diguanylate cyclase (GGDEF)-like protein
MQPPPPAQLPISEFFSLPTISLMIAITFIVQAVAIAINSRTVKEYQGIGTAFLATISLALSYIILLLFPLNHLTGTTSNLFTTLGHVLIYIAICQFIGTKFNRSLIYGLFPLGLLGYIALTFLPRGTLPVITITHLISFPLNLAAAYTLFRADKTRFKLGAYLMAFPLLIYGLITVVRFLTGIFNPLQVLPGQTASNIFDVMSLFILSYLWISGFILMISQRLQADLNELAMNDALTRVRNRRAMQGMLDFEMQRVQTEVKDFSVILLDVDHFKKVNDTHGHDVGDIVLQWMAQTLQVELRVQDIVARWGGEEFLILLPDTSLHEALEIAERLRIKIESTPVDSSPVPIQITFSAGVSNSKPNRNVDQLCKVADQALYLAKQTRNRVVSQDAIAV